MKKTDLVKLAERCRADGGRDLGSLIRAEKVTFQPENMREVAEGSPFAGQFQADRWKAYVEFDICHSLPVIAGPTGNTGNYLGYHPDVLARCHATLQHQQMNQHHLIKAYNPDHILSDAIVGAVVGTWFPEAPEGGWTIPEGKENAIAIRACGVVFRQAEGAQRMLDEITNKRRTWSVSIEVVPSNFESLGLYRPSTGQIVPLLEADDDLLECIEKDENGRMLVRKSQGEQIVLVMGAVTGSVEFQGVGYTPRPAEREAKIIQVLASGGDPSREMLEILAERCYAGSRLLDVKSAGEARLPGCFWSKQASVENPCVFIQLASGKKILKSADELEALVGKRGRGK